MPSYKTLVALALVASNVSSALSAPIPQVRKPILSHRAEEIPAEIPATAPKKSWGTSFKKYGKEFAFGMAATMALSYAFEKLSGSSSKDAAAADTASEAAAGSGTANSAYSTPNTAYSSPNTAYSNPNTAYSGSNTGYSSSNTGYSGSNTGYSSSNTGYSSPSSSYSTPANQGYSTSPYPNAQTQSGYQQRDVDRDLSADTFEVRSTSDNDQNRQLTSPDLLGRADLVAAIRLFSRMLDELD